MSLGFSTYYIMNLQVMVCMCVCARACTQSHLTLCDPMDCSPAGSSVHGILQARTLEWAAISFSRSGNDSFVKTVSFSILISFIFFPCLLAVTGVFSTILNKIDENEHPCLASDLR